MVHKLERDQHENARPLFSGPHLSLVVEAVIAGNSPERIWVDDTDVPRTAYAWDGRHCCYLAGDERNSDFLQEVRDLFLERIGPEAIERDLGIFKLYYGHEGWQSKLGFIFDALTDSNVPRCFYTLDRLKKTDWEACTPSGFALKRIDRDLLNGSLRNANEVKQEIEGGWYSLGDFLQHGFGFVLVNAEEVACWCTAEYVSEGKCGIGIETIEKYQGRGFATLTASCFVEHCASNGITPHWDSWMRNKPSIAVAEKVGFKKTMDYTVSIGTFTS